MKKLLLAGLLLAKLNAQAQKAQTGTSNAAQVGEEGPTQDPHIFAVAVDTPGVYVDYTSKATMEKAIMRERERRKYYQRKPYVAPPRGGYLAVYWDRPTLAEAAPRNFILLLATPTGRPLLRQHGRVFEDPPEIDNLRQSGDTRDHYNASRQVEIPHPMREGTRIVIVDSLAGKQYQFRFKK